MSNLRKRLVDVEEQKAFRDWQVSEREFKSRSQDELRFFIVYGYFPESLEGQTPPPLREEFTVFGVRVVITTERVGDWPRR
jgi:hypothetical protein